MYTFVGKRSVAPVLALLLACGQDGDTGPADKPAAAGGKTDDAESGGLVVTFTYEQDGKLVSEEKTMDGAEVFARGPVAGAGVERMPFVLFRLLPKLAEKLHPGEDPIFGAEGEEFEKFGFFRDTRRPQWPAPLGFTWTAPASDGEPSQVIRTCASCHVGRVRVGEEIRLLEGAGNHELDLHDYSVTWSDFVEEAFHPDNRENTKSVILDLLEERKDTPDWFFNGQTVYGASGDLVVFDKARAEHEIALVSDSDKLDGYLAQIYAANEPRHALNEKMAEAAANTGHAHPQATDIGPAGMIDTVTRATIALVGAAKAAGIPIDASKLSIGTAKTSIPPSWNQDRRTAGQWTANVAKIFYRNAVAALGFVPSGTDLNALNLELISHYVRELPAPSFPGKVDDNAVARGKEIYESARCGECHAADQRELETEFPPLFEIGTSDNRRLSDASEGVFALFAGAVLKLCETEPNKTLTVTIGDNEPQQPCKTDPSTVFTKRGPDETGYPAVPLDGVWARAPYLHNGSVPTLYHLLGTKNGASIRPAEFTVGSIDYDTDQLGWEWDGEAEGTGVYRTQTEGFSNRGHEGLGADSNGMWEGFKLSWDVDAEADELNALLAYLATL